MLDIQEAWVPSPEPCGHLSIPRKESLALCQSGVTSKYTSCGPKAKEKIGSSQNYLTVELNILPTLMSPNNTVSFTKTMYALSSFLYVQFLAKCLRVKYLTHAMRWTDEKLTSSCIITKQWPISCNLWRK